MGDHMESGYPFLCFGIKVAVILGIGTIIGETMIVLMVAGGAAVVPHWMFDAARPMPAAIAAEMAEAPYRSLHIMPCSVSALSFFL